MVDFDIVKREIMDIVENHDVTTFIVFGSCANARTHEDSDVDLLIVLDKKGLSRNYGEMLKNKKNISRDFRNLRKKIPVDLLVYTNDEWEFLRKSGSSFIHRIETEGIRLI